MSAEAVGLIDVMETVRREKESPHVPAPVPTIGWNPERFAREQIRGLVRQIFSSRGTRPVRQVVFSAAQPGTDVRTLCRRVGETLAMETMKDVAIVGWYSQLLPDGQAEPSMRRETDRSMVLRRLATQVRSNLWLVPAGANAESRVSIPSLHTHLSEVRREFEYSIVEGPPAGESNAATAMGLFADGIILVLSAQQTRRVTARKIKESLEAAQVRLLGTVLGDREFPIPDRIYRRL